MSKYNQYYQQKSYFGDPYPELIEYFHGLDRTLKVIDIGCGQGRDSIALGRMGFNVVGIDISEVGIEQMNHIAETERLSVSGMVKDYNAVDDFNQFDIILLDSIFHFYKKDMKIETRLLERFLTELKQDGRIVIITQFNKDIVDIIKKTMIQSSTHYVCDYEKKFVYTEFQSEFYIVAYHKL